MQNKPITDAEAEEMRRYHEVVLPAYLGEGIKQWIRPGREDTKRLLADREVAMEYVQEVASFVCYNLQDAPAGKCGCLPCKARALIAAVKGEG